jgi:hypothetical protein
LTVPLTCCKLMNKFETSSYLDPNPINITLCQSLDPNDFQKSRHTEVRIILSVYKSSEFSLYFLSLENNFSFQGCLDKIEYWYREHYIVLLCGGLVLAMVEFFVLLSIVLNCTRIKQNRPSKRISPIQLFNEEQSSSRTNSFHRNMTRENIYQDDFLSVTPEIREIFVQPRELNQHKYPPTKFSGNNYRLSGNSYLI